MANQAAGITGLIKTTLALKHKTIPASLHYSQANPSIDFDEGPFYVNTTTTEWKHEGSTPRTAAVSSFGIGGTNLHAILQELPPLQDTSFQPTQKLITFSAQSPDALDAYQAKLLSFVEHMDADQISNLAYTLQSGRKRFDYGKFVVAKDTDELMQALRSNTLQQAELQEKDQIVFMFSGQGSQYLNMGRSLYEQYPYFKSQLDNGLGQLERISGVNFRSILFNHDTNTEQINDTRFTQPILFLFEYALAKWLMHLGVQPDALIGHSLGEYVAACIAGVFDLEDALRLVNQRAVLMSQVERGDMIGVGTALEEIDPKIINGASIAAVNSPGSFVLSASKEEMDEVRKKLADHQISHIDLKTSHAFHSPMMEAILDDFGTVLETIEFKEPTIPFVSNITGKFITDSEAISVEYWKRHIVSSVEFAKGIGTLITQGHSLFIEVGPGKTLATFFKQSNRKEHNNAVLTTVRHPKEAVDDGAYFNSFLGKLDSFGVRVDWNAYYDDNPPRKISAPVYAFEPYEVEVKVSIKEQLGTHKTLPGTNKAIKDCFHIQSWKYVPERNASKTEDNQPASAYVIFGEQNPIMLALRQELTENGKQVIMVDQGEQFEMVNDTTFTVDPNDEETFQQLQSQLDSSGFEFGGIIYAWQTDSKSNDRDLNNVEEIQRQFAMIRNLAHGFELNALEKRLDFVLLSRETFAITGMENISIDQSPVASLLQILGQESTYFHLLQIDLQDQEPELATQVITEMEGMGKHAVLAYRNGRRWEPVYETLPSKEPAANDYLKSQGTYLITGNLDAIGHSLAHYLATELQSQVFILDENGVTAIRELDNGKLAIG
ncbi:MAG: type I polyketide synthase [Bacteroidota bacterium]